MTEKVKNARLSVIKNYCKSILWIDDEIDLCGGPSLGGSETVDARRRIAMKFFVDKANQFAASGALCHLQGFEATSGVPNDPYADNPIDRQIEVCSRLAERADIVILDWFLGNSDNSDCSERIIKHLASLDEFRFIVVLTHRKESAEARIKNTITGGEFRTIAGYNVFSAKGQFAVVLDKETFKADSCNLYDSICEMLCEVHNDYLHIAAIELLGKVRSCSPKLLSALPRDADFGIQLERAATMSDNSWSHDLQATLVENLMEDVSAIATRTSLEVLSEEALLGENCPLMSQFDAELACAEQSENKGVKDIAHDARGFLLSPSPQGKAISIYKAMCHVRENDQTVAKWVSGIESFSGFCDVKSFVEVADKKVCPGDVYEIDSDRVAVCVSAACDCVRDSHLLFLVGMRQKTLPDKAKGTCVRFKGNLYKFAGSGRTIRSVSKKTLERCRKVGALRKDVVARLISRFFGQMQRVGVNQPSVSRKIRQEGEI